MISNIKITTTIATTNQPSKQPTNRQIVVLTQVRAKSLPSLGRYTAGS